MPIGFCRAGPVKIVTALVLALTIHMVGSSIPARAETRVAFVIGNSAYQHIGKLKNARNDAVDLAQALAGLGFDVVKGINLTNSGFREALSAFRRKLRNADVALLFYAGHGVAVGDINYIIPVDANLAVVGSLEREAIRLDEIQALMEARPRTNLLIFDACRDDPFTRSISRSARSIGKSVSQGWLPVAAPKGTYISFATKPGDVAADGRERNSPFTGALLKHIATRGQDVQLMMRHVRQAVIDATDNRQVPWERSSLVGTFVFAPLDATNMHGSWLTTSKRRVERGEEVRLYITPPDDCRLTLINVDNRGKSCLLFPHPQLADVVLKAGQTTVFPPKGILRLDEPGEETFVALCNASPDAKQAAARNSRRIDCSAGIADRNFNDYAFETATFDLSGRIGKQRSRIGGQQVMLRGSVTIEVVPK